MTTFETIVLDDIKRGETFEFTVHFHDEGVTEEISVDDVKCEVRSKASGKLLEECTKEEVTPGTIKFSISDTDEWPLGDVEFDIDYTIDDVKFTSPTYVRKVIKDITRP
ncbi:MAG: hypothetical protein CVT92_02455 [Bacteroidetes bacterium HGW-Bacteroidetes-1]|nr:MAG: hypothetical protein CVT92_02455 [Bacteroidetes bacterium HGW-Bacteroidetes-1]